MVGKVLHRSLGSQFFIWNVIMQLPCCRLAFFEYLNPHFADFIIVASLNTLSSSSSLCFLGRLSWRKFPRRAISVVDEPKSIRLMDRCLFQCVGPVALSARPHRIPESLFEPRTCLVQTVSSLHLERSISSGIRKKSLSNCSIV